MYDVILIIAIGLALIVGAVALARTTELKDQASRDRVTTARVINRLHDVIDALERRP